MAHYAGVAGTKQLSNAIVDRAIEAFRKFVKEADELSQTPSQLNVGGSFVLDGEATLTKDNEVGVAVRASAGIAEKIVIEGPDLSVGRKAVGHVGAGIRYAFDCRITAGTEATPQLATREYVAVDGETVAESRRVENPNRLGR